MKASRSRGYAGFEGNVRATRREDGEQGDHERERALQADADEDVASDSARAEGAGEPLHLVVELAVRERGASEREGRRLGRPLDLRREEVHDRGRADECLHGRVPLDEQAPRLGLGQERERADGRLRRGGDAREQHGELRRHPVEGVGVEEIGRVLEHTAEPVRALDHEEREIDLGRPARGGQGAAAHAGDGGRPGGHRSEREHHLEERRPGEIALGRELLHQALEGQVLVRVGAQADLAHLLEERLEGHRRRRASRGARGC